MDVDSIAFDVTNPTDLQHEFVVGDAGTQAHHEPEMTSGTMHADSNSVEVAPGQTARLVYTFNQAGSLEIGCHIPGHYAAGMRGTITVT